MAIVDLGLTDEQYGHLTPAEFDALVERWRLRERRKDGRAALGAWATMKVWGGGDNDLEIDDFTLPLALLPEEPKWLTGDEPAPAEPPDLTLLNSLVPERRR